MTTPTDFNAVLMGGSASPAVKLVEGVTVSGKIVRISEPYQEREYDRDNPGQGAPKFFKNGNPILTFNLDLATAKADPDDDGIRRLYMDGARIKSAVRAGVQASGAQGLSVGGTLTVTCTHYDAGGDIRSGKNYKVVYEPGSAADAVLAQSDPETTSPDIVGTLNGNPITAAAAEAMKASGVDPATLPGFTPF